MTKPMLNLLLIASGLGVLFPNVVQDAASRLLAPSSPTIEIEAPAPELIQAVDALTLRLADSPAECFKIQGFYSTLADVLELGGIQTTQDVWQLNDAATSAMAAQGVEFLTPINDEIDNVIRAAWGIESNAVIPQKQLTPQDLEKLAAAYLAIEYAVRKASQ